jgi:3-oxoisoapionate decarboxylase
VTIDRRAFLAGAGAAFSGALATAQKPAAKLGVNLLSIAANNWTPFQYLDYVAKLNLQYVQFNNGTLGRNVDEAALQKVRAYAGKLGIGIDMYAHGSICPTSSGFNRKQGTLEEQLVRSMNNARILGATAMKVVVGGPKERANIEQHMDSTLRFLKSMRTRILDSGVRFALENHGDLQAREAKMLVDEAGRDVLGILLDSANPLFVLEDPHLTLELLAPYAVISHLRDTALWRVPEGVAARWVNMGDGNVDIAGWIRKFVQMRPDVTLSFENIVSPEPNILPVFEAEIWKNYRKMPAWEFSRYLAYAERGKPLPAVPPAPGKSRGQQQIEDFEASVRYVRKVLQTV